MGGSFASVRTRLIRADQRTMRCDATRATPDERDGTMVSGQQKRGAPQHAGPGRGLGNQSLACSFLAEHVGMEGDDALDGKVAGGSACREVG
jgi:hypothetical protein